MTVRTDVHKRQANMSVLGYKLPKVYEGRGPLEAASIGVDLKPGEMAMRCNLICEMCIRDRDGTDHCQVNSRIIHLQSSGNIQKHIFLRKLEAYTLFENSQKHIPVSYTHLSGL